MQEKVVIGRPGPELQQAYVRHHVVLIFGQECKRVITNDLAAIRHLHDRALLRTVAIAKDIAAGEKVVAVGTKGLLFGKTEKAVSRIVPEDDPVRPVRHEDDVGRELERAKQRHELLMLRG